MSDSEHQGVTEVEVSEADASASRELSPHALETLRQVDEIFRAQHTKGREPFVSEKPLSAKTCVLAMIPRTGSTALSSLLGATGVLGAPDEFFNPRGPLQMFLDLYPAGDMTEYVHTLRRELSSPNGVFAVKTAFNDLAPSLEGGVVSQLLGDTRFVYLTREDLIGQAISSYRAEESRIWHREQSGALYRPFDEIKPDPPFDEQRILRRLDEFVRMQQLWERSFALHGIEPLRVTYEEVVADATEVVSRIAFHVGVEWSGTVSLDSAVTSKLADERSFRWSERIRSSYRL